MAKEELFRAVIALVGRLISCILTSCSSSRRHWWGSQEWQVGVRQEGRGRVLTRTLAIRQPRAAACTQWSVNEDKALWDSIQEGLAAWASCQGRPATTQQAATVLGRCSKYGQVTATSTFSPNPRNGSSRSKLS